MKARGSVFVHPMAAQEQSISRDNKRGALRALRARVDGRGEGKLKCEV
jgi:hypothetical protein